MVYNEKDKNYQFYKLLKAERKLRLWAEIYPNAYIVGIFACCRQLRDSYEGKKYITEEKAMDFKQMTEEQKLVEMRENLEAKKKEEIAKIEKNYDE